MVTSAPAASWIPSRTEVQLVFPVAGAQDQGGPAGSDASSPHPSPSGDSAPLSMRTSTGSADSRTEASEEDQGDKAPKKVKAVKKVPKAEVRPVGPGTGLGRKAWVGSGPHH